jgi:PKD repeat protein
VPLSVSFRSFPSGGTGTYDFTWDFGDGAISHQRHPGHTYERPGVFSASVAVTSGDQVRACERSITTAGEAANPSLPPIPGPGLPDLVITITGQNGSLSFSPNPASARVGQRVIWRNSDALPHTATANGGAFDTGIVSGGANSAAIAMGAAGTFPYYCTVHPSMVGTLTVAP